MTERQRDGMDDSITRAELLATLREFVADRGIDPEAVTLDSSLSEDLELDSLDLMTLAQGWQKRYGITITDNESVLTITTVGQAIEFVVTQAAASGEKVQ
jgi:acyl carrier protein